MVKRSESDLLSLFQQQADSGLSANAFCKEHKLCPKYFSLRKKQLRQGDTAASTSPLFVTAKVTSPTVGKSSMVLSYHGCQLTLPTSMNEVWIANLLKALV